MELFTCKIGVGTSETERLQKLEEIQFIHSLASLASVRGTAARVCATNLLAFSRQSDGCERATCGASWALD